MREIALSVTDCSFYYLAFLYEYIISRQSKIVNNTFIIKQKKSPRIENSFFISLVCRLRLFNVENLLAVVVAANLTYAVGLEHLAACGVGALYKSGHSKLRVIGSSLISACAGHFLLRYCHLETSSRITLNALRL